MLRRRARVVNRAGPQHHQEPLVGTGQDAVDGLPRRKQGGSHAVGGRDVIQQPVGRRQLLDVADSDVVDALHQGALPPPARRTPPGTSDRTCTMRFLPSTKTTAGSNARASTSSIWAKV